jgi:hypothetical protein
MNVHRLGDTPVSMCWAVLLHTRSRNRTGVECGSGDGRTGPGKTVAWAKKHKVQLCFTPTSASWAHPIEAQFGPLRTFVMGGSDHPNHTVLARRLQDYLAWRNTNARHPDVLAAQRRERARIRSERQQRWGRPRPKAA